MALVVFPLRWGFRRVRSRLLSFLDMHRRWAFSLFSFALRLFRGGFVGLLPLVFKQLCQHLLEGIDRFLLSMNHLKLFPLDLGLLLKAPGRLLRNICHIYKGFFLYGRVQSLRLQRRNVSNLLQCPESGYCNWSGQSLQSECEYAGTLLLVPCQTRRSWPLVVFPYFCLSCLQ